jgi:Ser/Thr protein kinase RdoA (MazF antagonist)
MKRASGLVGLIEHVGDKTLRELCAERLQRFTDEVAPQLAALRTQVIYNDLNPSNVLVDADNVNSLAGVIDFGDMVFSPLVADVAVAAAYLCASDEDPFAEVVVFLRAYCSIVPLAANEVALLYDLILTRHLMTVVITNWRAAKYPENRDYILRNEPRARETINGVVRLPAAEVTGRFRQACGIA